MSLKKKLDELNEKRGRVWEEMKALNDKVQTEKREMSPEESQKWDVMDKDLSAFDNDIKKTEDEIRADEERVKRYESRKAFMESSARQPTRPDTEGSGGGENRLVELPGKESRYRSFIEGYRAATNNTYASHEYRDAYASFLAGGIRGLTNGELRALQADNDITGGFLVVPEEFINQLIMEKDNLVHIRRYARVFAVPNAASLGAPALEADPADPTWTAEIATGTEDSSMRFEKRELHPHPLAKRIKLSKKLLRVARMNVAALVNERLAYKFATVEENAFQNGTGANQPLGVFTASASGISTARDVSTHNTTTAIKADNLIEVKYTMEAQYRRAARWMWHRDALKMIRKLKDGEGNYLWNPGLAGDRPATILDVPYDESEYTPNTFTTGLYVGILADWSYYWIADALNMQVQVLSELYAETNQNGYIGRAETDGMPVHEKGFVRVKLG